ncbi:diacylglycerol kinase family lipid kinase [Pelagibius litoralis]|uniref:Diacylglycerol kinase family lipid kinase n=1 Tax=Pelagibius litoralis TaxID=374515 RepID=A0A967F182_9PROT|nr:diacylglycerol kinase family protein [Pelagibius litoralis]NIA71197.1 diacylglycerol kinase family lipid kinase [Pelagibius litoralis]
MTDSIQNRGAARRLLVIYNPTAGGSRRRRFEAVLADLTDLGCPMDVRPTTGPGDAGHFAAEADAAEHDLIVAAGGDGTINEVVNGLVDLTEPRVRPPLAILPLGTANVLAAELGLQTVPRQIAEVIAGGAVRSVCLGQARGADGQVRIFSLMAGAGFDARVVDAVDLRLKRILGKGAYVVESLRQMCRRQPPPLRVTIDGRAYEAASVVVSNGRFYAGRFLLAPEARLDEPCLHACLFRYGDPFNTLRYAVALQRGNLPVSRGFKIVTGQDIRIEGEAGAPLQADGDIVTHIPVSIRSLPDALQMVTASGPGLA